MHRLGWSLAIILFIFGALLPLGNSAAGNTCSPDETGIDAIACHDPFTSHLREKLAESFEARLKSADRPTKKSLQSEQVRWETLTYKECVELACVRDAYLRRLAELTPAPQTDEESQALVASAEKCPYCGVWAIYEADFSVGLRKLRDIKTVTGQYAFADETWLFVPNCYEGRYVGVSSTVVEQKFDWPPQPTQVYRSTIVLRPSSLHGECQAVESELLFTTHDFFNDYYGASISGQLKDAEHTTIRYSADNLGQTDPELRSTLGRSGYEFFSVRFEEHRLTSFAVRFRGNYELGKREPFDAAAFIRKTTSYCEKYYYDSGYNSAIGQLMGRCEQLIYRKKIAEFEKHLDCLEGTDPASCADLPTEKL